jgi:hypothetical protein
MRRRAALPGRTLNDTLSAQLGPEVVKLEALPIAAGQVVHVAFEATSSPWRQGVRVATEGALTANDVTAAQLDLWTDTAPPAVEIMCEATDGLIRIYNIWQSGRRPGVESQSHTSGMLIDLLPDGSRRYRCNDIGFDPDFSKLVFRISIT